MCEAFQVEIDYCALVTENAATTVADQFAPCNGYSYVFLCGGAMQIEHPNDFFRRDTAMLFHQINDPGNDLSAFTLCFWSRHWLRPPRLAQAVFTTLGDTGNLNSTTSYAKHF